MIELLVSVLIFVGLSLLGSHVLQTTQWSLSEGNVAVEAWSRENFFVKQVSESVHLDESESFVLEHGPDRIRFLTTRSAVYGPAGPVMVVEYRYEPGGKAVVYGEELAPGWWDRSSKAWRDAANRAPDDVSRIFWPSVRNMSLTLLDSEGEALTDFRGTATATVVLDVTTGRRPHRIVAHPAERLRIP